MTAHSNSRNSDKSAVSVSYRMQLAAVLAFGFSAVTQFAMFVPTMLSAPQGSFLTGLLPMLSYSLSSILLFVLFYLSSAKYPQILNRMFMAVIKSFVIISLFGFLQGARTGLMMLTVRSSRTGLPSGIPSWIMSSKVDLAIVIICFAAAIVLAFVTSRRKG